MTDQTSETTPDGLDVAAVRERVAAAIAHARTNIPLLVAALDEAREGHEFSDCGVVAETQICSACAGIAVRESDGVGLREDERQAIESAFADNQQATGDWLITRREWRQLFAAVEKIIAARVDEAQVATWDGWEAKVRDLEARVAEAGARALEEAANVTAGWDDAISPDAEGFTDWLRDRARGLRS